jgi:hypothetical protein
VEDFKGYYYCKAYCKGSPSSIGAPSSLGSPSLNEAVVLSDQFVLYLGR